MRILIYLIFISVFIVGDAVGNDYKTLIVGVWGNSDDKGKTITGYEHYLANGTLKSWGILPDTNLSYEIEATYKLIHKFSVRSCMKVTKSSVPHLLPVGEYWCD